MKDNCYGVLPDNLTIADRVFWLCSFWLIQLHVDLNQMVVFVVVRLPVI